MFNELLKNQLKSILCFSPSALPKPERTTPVVTGIVFREEGDCASNGGGGHRDVCVNNKVHLRISESCYDQPGDECNAHIIHITKVLGPCDGTCHQIVELNNQQEELIEEFIATGKKGKHVFTTRLYPEMIPEEDDNPIW